MCLEDFCFLFSSLKIIHTINSMTLSQSLELCSIFRYFMASLVCQMLFFSCSVVSDSLRSHILQQPGLPVLHYVPEFAQTRVHWVNDASQPSSSVAPFSSYPQSFPASKFFPVSQLFASGGQNIGALDSE